MLRHPAVVIYAKEMSDLKSSVTLTICSSVRKFCSFKKFNTPWHRKVATLFDLSLAKHINLPKMTFDSFSPLEVIEAVGNTGVHKGNMRLDKVFFSAVSAGCLLSFACGTALSTNASPWFQENAAGLIRTISALVFPYGLCMIILTGADLCTGSFMVSSSTSLSHILANH